MVLTNSSTLKIMVLWKRDSVGEQDYLLAGSYVTSADRDRDSTIPGVRRMTVQTFERWRGEFSMHRGKIISHIKIYKLLCLPNVTS